MPVSFTLNRVTELHTDADSDGYADAGDVLRHILTITNTGDTAATSVVLNDLLGGSTETGLMNISPIAFNDAFTAIGNTALRVGGAANIGSGPSSTVAGNLLANDVGSTTVGVGALAADDVTGFTLDTVTNGVSTQGGTFNIFADGSFNYISQAGDQGTDTFTYTIRDAGIDGIAGNSDDTTSTATVTITITGQVWYVDSAASAVGADGTSAHPFTTITALNTANVDGANDYIYVKGNATGQLVMETGEHLIGTGADLDVAGFHLADDAARSTITGSSAGFTVTLAGAGTGNNEIAGINILSTGGTGNHALTGTSFGTLTISNTTVDASGQGVILSTGAIAGTGLVSTDSDGGTNNVSLTTVTGTLALGTGALSGATGSAFNVSGGSVTATYSGNVTQATAGQALVNVTAGHTGTLTFSTGTLSATNGTGLQFDNADGNYNFNGTNTLNGGDAGVDIVNGSGGNFSFSSSSSITNPTGIAFNVNGGAGNIDYNGTISHTANTRAISVQNHTGGTVSFDGTVSATGSSDGILLATNTGAIINFTNQLTINATGANFDASGGGTITATGSGNVINSGTSAVTALSVQNTNIGLAGLNFVSISSTNATGSGILLNNTGTTAGVHGGLTVTGDGGSAVNASGGTISGAGGVGISLTSTRAISLDQMTIQNGLNDGINGNTVTNFTLTNSTVTNNGDALQEHGAQFDNLFGTNVFTNVTFSNNETSQVTIINTSGTTDVQFSNSSFSSTGVASAPNGLHGVHMETQGTATGDLRILNSAFNNLFSNSIHATNEGTGTFEVTVANTTFNNVGASAINIVQNNTGTVRFWVHDNPTFLRGSNNGTSHSININQGGGATAASLMEGRINNNVIGNNTSSTSGNTGGAGIQVLSVGSGTVTVQIDNNNIQGVGGNGINVQMSEDTNAAHTMNATIFSNTVSVTDVNSFDGIRVVAGAASGDAGLLRLDMHDNTASSATANDFTVRQRFATTMQLLNIGGSNNSNAAVQTYLDVTRANDAAHNVWFITNDTVLGGGFDSTASVPAPTLPSPLLAGTAPPPAPPADPGPKADGDGTGGELPTPGGGDPAPAPAPSGQPVVVDDGVLSQAELNLIVNAAIDRWAAAGASAEDIAAMRAVTFSVADMSGLSLGSSTAGSITLDSNAAGFSWFIDATPGEDSEYSGSGTHLTAIPGTVPAIRIDLLTTVMHELGHQIGLVDSYASGDNDNLMYGLINPGERRLPGADDVDDATGAPVSSLAFALSPVTLGTIPAGRIVVVQWDSTVNAFTNQIVPTFNNTSSVSGGNFVTTTSNTNVLAPTGVPSPTNVVLDSLTLGNLVFLDANNNGVFDGGDTGINGVALTLFADTNANGVFDSGVDVQLATTTTAGGGLYSFANLAPGDYIVRVDAANFTGGGALLNRVTATGAADPDDNVEGDDNGANGAGGIVVTQAITLTQNGETTLDGSGKLDINNTLDLGFIELNDPPVNTVPGTQTINEGATATFTGGTAISVNDVDVGAGNLTVTLSVNHGVLTLSGTAGLAFGAGDGTTDATMTFTGTQAAVNAALNGLVYTPNTDFNGSDTLTVTTNDNGNTGSDPGTSGGPADEQDSDTVTINITAINDAPTVVNGTTETSTTIAEDTPLALGQSVTALFGGHYSDAADNQVPNGGASSPGAFTGIAVTANGSSGATGQWQYSTNGGASWQDIGAVTDATARLYNPGTLIRFNPTLDYNGAEPTLTVHLIDNSGPAITDHSMVNLSGVGATGGTTRYSAGTVDLGGTVTSLNDAPVNTVPGTQTIDEDGTVTFSTGNGNAISVNDVDVGGGDLTVTIGMLNGQLTLSGTAGLTFSNGDGTDDTTMTFTGTQAAINAALQGLLYEATLNNNGSDTLTFTVNDQGNTGADPGLTGDGSSEEDSDTVTININAVNDTPVLTVATPLASTEQVFATIDAAASVSDLDLDALNGGNGDYGGATLTVARQGGANADDLFQFAASGSFTVNGGNLESGGLVFASFTNSGGTLTVSFNDSGTTATTALVNAVLEAIQYANNNDTPPASIDLNVTLDDGAPANAGQGSVAGHPATATATVHVNITDAPENQPPVVDLNGAGAGIDDSNLYVENGAASGVGVDIQITDAENDNIQSATVTITDPEAGDLLSVNLPLPPGITVDTVNSTATTLILIGSATADAYEGALGQVGYSSSSDDPTDGGTNPNRLITVVVNDGTANSAAATMTMTIAGVNDEPTLTATGTDPTYTENGAAVDLFSGVTVTTPEGGQALTSLTLTVTNVTDGADEILSFDGSDVALTNGNAVTTATNGLNVTVTVSSGTATVTFSGASLTPAQVQTLVDAMTYRNAGENPTDADRVVTITELVDNGSGVSPNDNTATLSVSSTVDVAPVNDDAIITGDITGDVTEAGGMANGTPGTPTATGDLDSTDVDNTADAWQAVAAGAATANGYGTYELAADGSWTYTLDDDNATVEALNGAATLTDTFDALTADGTSQTVTITIHAQDDAPTIKPDLVTTDEGSVLSGSVFADNGSGPDNDPDGPAITVTAVNGSGANVGMQITLASGAKLTLNADGTFDYDPNGVFDATPTPGSGASNQPAGDTFNYTAGGTTVTVSVTVNGLDSNDLLLGTAGADTLTAGIGNDYLDGLAGIDQMFGQAGDDAYVIDNMGDLAIELSADGRDIVYASVSYELSAGSEIEVLSAINQSGTAPLVLVGNNLGQEIYGNAGANFLEGGGGTDYLVGFGGNDSYVVDGTEDVVVEAVGAGTDIVYARASYALSGGAEVEILSAISQSATTALNLIGNGFGQAIYGNAGTNYLEGGGGADILTGLGGDDVYLVDSASDYVSESAGGGRDVVYTTVSYALGAGEEIEVLSTSSTLGTTAINLTGNNLSNELYGNAGVNVLNGGAGADYMTGFAGADTFQFTTALGAGNIDQIGDFLSGTDKIALDDAIFDQLLPGALGSTLFHVGAAATDEDQRIIYDSATGNLYYDADGTGATAQVWFATLNGHPPLAASDFVVI